MVKHIAPRDTKVPVVRSRETTKVAANFVYKVETGLYIPRARSSRDHEFITTVGET